jgi:hypothetical protein
MSPKRAKTCVQVAVWEGPSPKSTGPIDDLIETMAAARDLEH